MASKAVRDALNLCGWSHNGNPLGPTADDPALLHTLVAHATEAERAALLRTLLGERIDQMVAQEQPLHGKGRVWMGDINETDDGDFSAWVKRDDLLNLLAPERAP